MRLASRVTALSWFLIFFLTLSSINFSLFGFVIAISSATELGARRLIWAFAELLRLSLSGWLFFSLLLKPGAKQIVPEASVRQNKWAFRKVFFGFLFIEIWRIIIGKTGLQLAGIPDHTLIPDYIIIILSTIAVLATIVVAGVIIVLRKRNTTSDSESRVLLTQTRALQKIERRLSISEQQDLRLFLYKNKMANKVSVQNLAKAVWFSLFVALIINVIKELFHRS